MATIDLLSIAPHQVSRDMRGYSVMLYGDPKSGKTTTATKFPNHLLLATEKGYSAIPGAMAQPINSWAEFKQVLNQLKKAEVQAKFETIIIDTCDILWDYCEKYICANAPRPKELGGGFGVDAIGDIPYGKGYTMVAKEFDEALRLIVQLNYGLVLISHAADKVFKDEMGQDYNKIVPTLDKRPKNIVARLCDIIGYSRSVQLEDGTTQTRLFMRGTPRYEAGSRFKYTPDSIEFTYNELVKSIGDAIDKQMQEDGTEYFTEERQNLYVDTTKELDFDELMAEFNKMVNGTIEKLGDEVFGEKYFPKLTDIIDKYLGKGVKITTVDRGQVEAVSLIVDDVKELLAAELS